MEHTIVNSKNITSQDTLHELEALCTATEAPACTAICPLHVDCKTVCRQVSEGNFIGAFKTYQKAVPFSWILAYACEAPCESKCIRKDFGGVIHMRDLERAICETAAVSLKVPAFLMKKEQRIAIVGGGIRGISAAYDLAIKGYKVTINEKNSHLWGKLYNHEKIPVDLLESESEILNKLKVDINLNCIINTESVDRIYSQFIGYDVVIVTCEIDKGTLTEIKENSNSDNPIIAGNSDTTVFDMAGGRSMAITTERLIKKVNIDIGRDKEGSYETTLITNTNHVTYCEAILPGDGIIYTKEEAKLEAGRCIDCKCELCVEKCGFLKAYKKTPKEYIREVYNNLSIAMGTHYANDMINSCSLCGQCESICPNGLDMSDVFLSARNKMKQTNKMPQSAFEFGMNDLEHSISDVAFLAQSAPGRDKSKALFFPGCQLVAISPKLVMKVYDDLRDRYSAELGFISSCCGITAVWAGEEEKFESIKQKIRDIWQRMGEPLVITGCPNCSLNLSKHMGIETKTVYEVLNEIGVVSENSIQREMYLHHACGARHDVDTKECIRKLCNTQGIKLDEISDTNGPCCGYGGLAAVSNEEISDEIKSTGLQSYQDTEIPILTYCANCKNRYTLSKRESYHILEILYLDKDEINDNPVSLSTMQENREWFKAFAGNKYWNEGIERIERMKLLISDELETEFERMHILRSDIADVIEYAQETGNKMKNIKNGHFTAYHRPKNVTFWVEYSLTDDGYLVHKAYCHRMDFIISDKIKESGGN
ncbi:MAG: pyridine nucleotide-disulfide oxidoreductase/dicluster-binding protein [Suipraeoptans sp.]